MNNYNLVLPEEYSSAHLDFIESVSQSMQLLSSQLHLIFSAKDIQSRHIISTDTYAHIVGVNSVSEVIGKLDAEFPSYINSRLPNEFVAQDQILLKSMDVNKTIETINTTHYGDGLKSRRCKKSLLHHKETNSILGIVLTLQEIDLLDALNILPQYSFNSGIWGICQTNNSLATSLIDNKLELLNEYEREICFLIIHQWTPNQIAVFMNTFRPVDKPRTADTIIKKRNYICQKLGLRLNSSYALSEYLMATNLRFQIPESFYSKNIGSRAFRFS
ncbi:hypothetical protein [Aquella oligotrophica]|uniref:HTH luxR-type domain-containing protein n=1 Tax=Aquella oligotrophica TaxID=2067065 RepID=A0A2I7N6M8_9NEIS|nr:hypothetical protein [Aquella oligotrophica]AUR51875.1 hypothetical protein CUN60_06050 [Aquella oligotrophica]